jgi:outer membrane protein assembly factor BamB
MNLIPRPDRLASAAPLAQASQPPSPRHEALLGLLLGEGSASLELPPLFDLVATVLALAEGQRRKAILPLAASTGEFAMVRRGEHALVSYYDGGPVPQLFVRDRAVPLSRLCTLCADAADELAEQSGQQAVQRTARLVAERARRAQLAPDRRAAPVALVKRGGAQSGGSSALEFGFSVRVVPGEAEGSDAGARADVHALLFDGELWAFMHGRRIALLRGAVFPAVVRMVNAARAVVDAWESQRATHLKLKAGEFGIGMRLEKSARLTLTLTRGSGDMLTLPASDVPSVVLPILRLGAELARTVVSTDRAQSRNLRLSALRDEVRALRRTVRARSSQKSFTNSDPDLLRASAAAQPPREAPRTTPALESHPGKLRLSLRWRAEIDGLDASSTFLCGDRLVIATARTQLALGRDDGELLWMRHAMAAGSWMAGTTLVSVNPEGEVELCDVSDGETYARSRIAPRVGGLLSGLCAGGRNTPPVAVITEGRDRLVALDVRTGEPRWRFRSRGRGNFRLTRAGRILLVVSGDSTLHALDVASGEVAWRWSDPGRLSLAPVVTRDHAVAVVGHPGSPAGALLCFDLFSGELVFRTDLEGAPLTSPVVTDQLAVVARERAGQVGLAGYDLPSGALRWAREDPGLGEGGSPLIVDQHLVVNTPGGSAFAIELSRGELRWEKRMADPARDDVPRRLEPVLRGGALFLPSASVHVVRPADGSVIGGPISEGIIPDVMRVDERGWLYLAEESGHIEAYAPAPNLRLVR